MDKNKKIIIILSVLTVIFTVIGASFAYLTWQTTEAQKTNIVFTVSKDFSCAADGGGNIETGDVLIVPTEVTEENRAYYIKREVTVTPTITVGGSIYMDLWLDINSIGTGLSNSDYFMYSFTKTDTSPYQDVVVTGNFKGKQAGDKIILLDRKDYLFSTTDTYYLWIWLDAEETSSSTMNQVFSLSLNGSCTDKNIPNEPVLDEGMIPITFDVSENNTIIKTVSSTDSSWYNYDNKEWANSILVTESSRSKYLNTTNIEVDQSDILAYFVWIPRYKYKIWTLQESSTGQEQEIEIIFQPNSEISTGSQVGEYITHPAFWWDNDSDGVREAGEELSGIWVGKFETTGSATTPTILPDTTSLIAYQNMSAQFQTSLKFAGGTLSSSNLAFAGSSTYGLTANADSHMMKNSEWGAVAYLSHSKYGSNREIYINNGCYMGDGDTKRFYTGRSGGNVSGSTPINGTYPNQSSTIQYNTYGFHTWDGYLLNYNTNDRSSIRDMTKVASTTGNITGVYDMSGGANDHVMGNYNNVIAESGFNVLPSKKYYDLYTSTNILEACNGAICFGHALSETKNWHGDYMRFVTSSTPWFYRGLSCNNVDGRAGIFGMASVAGGYGSADSFRVTLVLI